MPTALPAEELQGSILQNSILAEKFSDKFISSNFGQKQKQHKNYYGYTGQ
jgi:hypothetical protein